MRDYKFGGKRVDNGEWAYGYFTKNESSGKCYIITQTKAGGAHPWEVIPETVGEYSGLKDKNGNEIYEGDIYHQGDKNIKYIVVWHDSGLIGKQVRSSSYAGLEYWKDRIEIIGNIHDNPEMMEVKHGQA